MDSNEHNKVNAFDTLFCTNHIQMLKVILTYMDNRTQKSLAVYIKFLELQYTINYYRNHSHPLYGCAQQETSFDIAKMCGELLPYCTEEERKRIEQIRGLLRGMEMYKEMSKTMEMMKEFMPDMGDMFQSGENPFFSGTPFSGGNPFSDENPFSAGNSQNAFPIMDMLMNMLSPEQKEMFTMLGGMNHDN